MKKDNEDIKIEDNIDKNESTDVKVEAENSGDQTQEIAQNSKEEKKKEILWICLILLIFAGISIAASGISGVFNGTENVPTNPDTPDVPDPVTKETTIKVKASTEALSFKTIKNGLEIDVMTGEVSLEKLEEYFTITNAVDGATYIVEDFSQTSKRNEEYETKEATIKIKVDKSFTGEVDEEGEDITEEKTFEIKFNTQELVVSSTKITMKITEYKKTIADFSFDLGVPNLENVSTPTEIKIEKLEKFFDIDNGVDGATYSIKDMVETNDGNYGFKLIASEVYDDDGETANNVEEEFAIKTNPSYVAPIMLILDESDFAMINPDWVGSEEYKEWDGTLVIPKRINGTMFQIKPAPLPDSSFAKSIKDDLKHLIIEGEKYDGIDSIPQYAFYECKNLESVEVSEGYTNLKSVYVGAFNGCTNLKTFDFTNITSFGNESFKDTGLIGDIELNKDAALNSQSIFKGCNKLDSITVTKVHSKNLSQEYGWAGGYWNGIPVNQIGSNIKTYPIDQFDYTVESDSIRIKNITNDYADELKEMSENGTWDGTLTFPGEIEGKPVRTIERVFKNNNDLGIKKLVFSEPVTDNSYYKSINISGVLGPDLPDVVEMVGTKYIKNLMVTGVFEDMKNLEGTIDLSGTEKTGGSTSIPASTFAGCEKLEDIILPNLRNVGDNAFKDCYKFKPNQKQFFKKLFSIGSNAFANCISLTNEVDISRIENISTGVFSGCVNLEGVIYLRALRGEFPPQLFKGCDPDKLTVQVHDKAFIEIENDTAGREMREGSGTAGFEKVIREEFLFNIDYDGVITSFNNNWFTNVPASMQADWENGIINVPEYIDNIKVQFIKGNTNVTGSPLQESTVFHKSKKADNDKIKQLNFAPGGLEKIGPSVFWDLEGLEVVTGLDNVAVAEDYIFNKCKNLKTVDFSEKLNDIKQWAFKDCNSLESVETKNVTSIGQEAFQNNFSLNPVAESFLNVEKLSKCFNLPFYPAGASHETVVETTGWQNDISFPKWTSSVNDYDQPFTGITTGITIGVPSGYYEKADDKNNSPMSRFVGKVANTDDASAEPKELTFEFWGLDPNPGQKSTSNSMSEIFETFLKSINFYNINKKD
ncbi:MAG: leucine-rich repeat protein [Mycoplasma sp.]